MTDPRFATGDELTVAELYALLKLRISVFVVEQRAPYPELDGRDLLADTEHLWYPPAGEPQAYLRLVPEPAGGWRIGRVCTTPAVRGTGLGGRLMAEAMTRIGDASAVLDAQTYAQDFYARYGFVPVSEPYDDDGIEHITMRRPAVEHSG
ncbi:GNAT family N-acetyltransferase [Actinophytocola sediminis]